MIARGVRKRAAMAVACACEVWQCRISKRSLEERRPRLREHDGREPARAEPFEEVEELLLAAAPRALGVDVERLHLAGGSSRS
jgi:hypothetical protein